jgi:IclR family KDG regulon transcriptional repressor
MVTKTQDSYLVNSLERGLEALLLFQTNYEMSFSEFVLASGLNKATAKRILYTLESQEFVKYDEVKHKYVPGIKLFELGTLVLQHFQLLNIARPFMEKISQHICETVLLSQQLGHEQLYLSKIELEGSVRLPTLIGKRRPLYYGLGKAILAFLNDKDRAQYVPETLPCYTIATKINKDDFLSDLNTARDHGYAVDEEEYIENVIGIGAPIFKNGSTVCAVLGVTTPANRMTCEKRDLVVNYVTRYSETISNNLVHGLGELV